MFSTKAGRALTYEHELKYLEGHFTGTLYQIINKIAISPYPQLLTTLHMYSIRHVSLPMCQASHPGRKW